MKVKSLFQWELPSNIYDRGLLHCSRKLGGCGQWHEFTINNSENYFIEWNWEERECEKFADWLEAEARQEWEEEIKQEYCKLVVAEENLPAVKGQVSIKDTQWEKEFGAIRPVGFYRQRKEIFVCGHCSAELKGSCRHGVVKNRNNPGFWGLEVEEKVLCLGCVKKKYYSVINWERKKVLRKYLKRGYK